MGYGKIWHLVTVLNGAAFQMLCSPTGCISGHEVFPAPNGRRCRECVAADKAVSR